MIVSGDDSRPTFSEVISKLQDMAADANAAVKILSDVTVETTELVAHSKIARLMQVLAK